MIGQLCGQVLLFGVKGANALICNWQGLLSIKLNIHSSCPAVCTVGLHTAVYNFLTKGWWG